LEVKFVRYGQIEGKSTILSGGLELLERAMGFEPTVSTLGRSHVTTTPSPQTSSTDKDTRTGAKSQGWVPPTGLEPARPKGTGPQPAAYTIPPRGLKSSLTPRQSTIKYIMSCSVCQSFSALIFQA
jgi:hypothetical protein